MSEQQTGHIDIRGRDYKTVALRLSEFRKEHPDWPIETELLTPPASGDQVVMKTAIKNQDGRTIATGHAHEVWTNTGINQTSALENCETSSVGRALAFYGLAGTEIASADEVAGALNRAVAAAPPGASRRESASGGQASGNKPPAPGCPSCGAEAIIVSKPEYGGGFVCWKGKNGCGAKFDDNMQLVQPQSKGATSAGTAAKPATAEQSKKDFWTFCKSIGLDDESTAKAIWMKFQANLDRAKLQAWITIRCIKDGVGIEEDAIEKAWEDTKNYEGARKWIEGVIDTPF